MRTLFLTAALLASVASAPALAAPAAEPAPAAQPADAGKAERIALARRYFAAIHYDELMNAMVDKMMPAMLDQFSRTNPGLTDKERAAIIEAATEATKDFDQRFREETFSVIADTFSEEELKAMVDFYEGTLGQSIMRKTPTMIPRLTELAVKEMPQVQADTLKRLCAKLDCSKVKLPTGTPS